MEVRKNVGEGIAYLGWLFIKSTCLKPAAAVCFYFKNI